MSKINYVEAKNKILNNFTEKCILIKGKSASGKTTLAIEKYKHMIEEENIKSEKILVLIMNRHQSLTWKKKLMFKTSGENKINTYQGFIRKELIKYWPIVENSCKDIKRTRVRPEFVSTDTANYMMETLVNYFRNKKAYFADITSTSRRIAVNIVSNINKAALSMIDMNEIGTRIFNSRPMKNGIDKATYEQMDEVILHYISSFLKQGVMDYGISVYLYNKYLLKNEIYNMHLKNIKYLLVDDLDEVSPAQLELINIIAKSAEETYLFSNPEGAFCTYYGADIEYLNNNLKLKYEQVELEESFLCSKELLNVADKINANNLNLISKYQGEVPIYIDLSSQLRSEMIEKIALKVKELIEDGKNPGDIAIISPFNDFILGYEIENKVKVLNVGVTNTYKTNRLIDNPYIHALVIIACLCNRYSKINLDGYRRFFSTILDIDSINASKLAKITIKNGGLQDLAKEVAIRNKFSQDLVEDITKKIGIDKKERYDYLRNFVENYRQNDKIPLDELFRRAFLELLIILPEAKQNILICKNLSEVAEKFISVLMQFNTIDNLEEKFIEFILREGEDFYSQRELEKLYLNPRDIIITNPYNFLTSSLKSSIQIWTDINSTMWTPRNIKELTNDYVLRKNWNIDEIYSDEIEEKNKQHNLTYVIKSLIRKCREKIYIYGSDYSINGYEQQSSFSDTIMDLISEGGNAGAV